jgi:dCMP deaminase
MRHVYLIASKSKDPRTKIGAVLVKDGVIIIEGYNGFARGVLDLQERYTNRETKYKFVVHAEHNCVLNAARRGISTVDSVLYTQGVPCAHCADVVIQAGIQQVIVHKQWPNLTYSPMWVESFELAQEKFKEAGVVVCEFNGKLKLDGFLDGKKIRV